jgi:hypothetical protein
MTARLADPLKIRLNQKETHFPHLDGAACNGHAQLMDGEGGQQDVLDGLRLCFGCPVFKQCNEWVEQLTKYQKRHCLSGVVAGRVWGEPKRWLNNGDRKRYGGIIPK